MKRVLLSIFTLFIGVSAGFANNKYEGYYVSKTGDTVKCKIKISSALLKKQELNPLSVTRNLRIELPNGENQKFSPNEIKSFTITGLTNSPSEFKSIKGDNEHFYRVWAEGKINLYSFYSAHPYDHSPVPHFFTINEDGKMTEIAPRDVNKCLAEMIKDDKELYNAWMNKEYEQNGLVSITQLYNARYLAASAPHSENTTTLSATKN
ncbi:hypothetical protein [Desertivirga arenae]|uniref:hypothetical protein n=1 Tax=Desertivirga arenae TaxID=2810309 RepID=UPI001A976C1E|nr:hypothetical protein [Pedobacter sp. SYSU D00823]